MFWLLSVINTRIIFRIFFATPFAVKDHVIKTINSLKYSFVPYFIRINKRKKTHEDNIRLYILTTLSARARHIAFLALWRSLPQTRSVASTTPVIHVNSILIPTVESSNLLNPRIGLTGFFSNRCYVVVIFAPFDFRWSLVK